MDLLDEKVSKKPRKSKGQKIVLTLLIVSVILFVAIAAILVLIRINPIKKEFTISINGNIVANSEIGLIQTKDEDKYISIRALCGILGYNYFNGEYNTAGEDKDKGYVNNGTDIIQFYSNSNNIFKTQENAIIDYENFELKKNIILYNDALYINIEDLNVALNLLQNYSETDNRTTIITPKYWLENNKADISNLGYTEDETSENERALSYGYVVVKSNGKYGVISLAKKEIIGNKYNSITFVEYTKHFIVSNNSDKYGVINTTGATVINLQFDSLEVLNHEPLLFKVKKQNNYGIMKEDGTIISEINYSSIGYPEDKANNIYYTLIIPELNENIPQSIVVCNNNKYGLIDLENGREIIPCVLKGIFLLVDVEKDLEYYVVQLENGTYNTLESYINSLNQITVNINQ